MNGVSGMDPMMYENDPMSFGVEAEPLHLYAAKTFGWMFVGLLITFVSAIVFAVSGGLYLLYSMGMAGVLLLAVAEVLLVVVLSSRLDTLSIGAARGLFFLYAVINGLTFSSILILFDLQTLLLVFLMTSAYFGVLAAYGWLTKRDISRIAPILIAGLVVLAVFWLLSLFFPIAALDRVICFVGLAIFMGLTAYDVQKLKYWHAQYANDYEMSKKSSIFGALQLYLDFLNIFLYILRLLARNSRSSN
ncbi:MAG: Bax inhibitor-1/YccA family protein [Subdoligranulum sp.]|nr:Bax inhibitor-1/YccA family protein [Subdoligranulum sp.]MBD5102280.1 Bax inhibitor-1/YccA family protein [Subdoligranulum sp.]